MHGKQERKLRDSVSLYVSRDADGAVLRRKTMKLHGEVVERWVSQRRPPSPSRGPIIPLGTSANLAELDVFRTKPTKTQKTTHPHESPRPYRSV